MRFYNETIRKRMATEKKRYREMRIREAMRILIRPEMERKKNTREE